MEETDDADREDLEMRESRSAFPSADWEIKRQGKERVRDMKLSSSDWAELERLEEELWSEATRFDGTRMNELFAPDFYEIGRSGKIWSREACLAVSPQPIQAVLPLPEFRARLLHPDVALVTYDSAVTYSGVVLHAHRSSIWSRGVHGWQLRFHQGTPYEKKA